MTYGTYSTIKQALESMDLKGSIVIRVVNGVVEVLDENEYRSEIEEEIMNDLRDDIYDEAYDEGYRDGLDEATAENDSRR